MPSPVDSINTGTAHPGSSFNVFFAPNGYFEPVDFVRSEGWNNFEIEQFQTVFDKIEEVADVNFNITTNANNADYILVLDTNELGSNGSLGYMYLPNGSSEALVGVFNGAIWDRGPGGDLEIGGYSYVTMAHEMLHGMGLGHPHDSAGGTTVMNGVSSAFDDFGAHDLNQGVFTTMTYNSGHMTGDQGDSGWQWGYEAGPMALDIAALQDLYGANTSHAGGNNTYVLPGSNSQGTHWESIWDTGGKDTIKYGGSRDATINLNDATLNYEAGGGGFISSANGIAGGFTIANGVVIENAVTGKGDDMIVGNQVRNVIKAGGGGDLVYGGGGNDKIKGGGGHDDLYGDNGRDKLVGGGGTDYLFGGAGNDILKGGKGADEFDFTEGKDKIKDFGKGADMIFIDSAVTNGVTNVQQVINSYADDSGDHVVFDFGGGDILTVQNVENANSLLDDIMIY